MTIKSFIILAPGVDVLKLFSSSLTKLVCLFFEIFANVLQVSLILASKDQWPVV
jgi:hypothetical protein